MDQHIPLSVPDFLSGDIEGINVIYPGATLPQSPLRQSPLQQSQQLLSLLPQNPQQVPVLMVVVLSFHHSRNQLYKWRILYN